MWSRLTSRLKPPIYPDEDQTRIARLIHIFLLMTLCLNALRAVGVLSALPGSAPLLAALAVSMLISLSMLWLVRRPPWPAASTGPCSLSTWSF